MSSAPSWTADLTIGGVMYPERVLALERVRELLTTERKRVLRLLTDVSTHQAADYEIDAACATLAGAASEVEDNRPGPVSGLAVFMPGNVPLYSYVLYLLVPLLFSEQATFRPSSRVAPQTLALHDLLAAAHQLPVKPMVVSQRAFIRDGARSSDVVVFSGTYKNAEQVRRQLHHHQLFLYLGGGVNPFIVAPGADLDLAARDAVRIRLLNSGQDCLAPDVVYVNHSDLGSFTERVVALLEKARFGPYTDPEADYGPILYDDALERATAYLMRNQRQLAHGGQVDFRSRRIDPAVVVRPWAEGRAPLPEVFAPIFTIIGYGSEADLIATINGGAFAERAMGASVYGRAPQLVAALRQRHMVTVDSTLLSIDNGNHPFGGRGRMANYVACRGRLHPEPVLVSKAVADHLAPGPGEPDLDAPGGPVWATRRSP